MFTDFDGDDFIGSSDIEHAVKLLTQNELNNEEIESVWEKVNIDYHLGHLFHLVMVQTNQGKASLSNVL